MTDPFALIDQLNAGRAAREAEEVRLEEIGTDQTRIQRDAQRRERLGRLRARPRPSKRPNRARPVQGYMEEPAAGI